MSSVWREMEPPRKEVVMSKKVKVGDAVRVRGQRLKAVIEGLYSDVEGGVILDRRIDGFYSWNVQDLRRWNRRARRKG